MGFRLEIQIRIHSERRSWGGMWEIYVGWSKNQGNRTSGIVRSPSRFRHAVDDGIHLPLDPLLLAIPSRSTSHPACCTQSCYHSLAYVAQEMRCCQLSSLRHVPREGTHISARLLRMRRSCVLVFFVMTDFPPGQWNMVMIDACPRQPRPRARQGPQRCGPAVTFALRRL